ncbi:MAG: Fic family protein [Candidatus Paceibacterota bacterium]|jgi:Fic family protein
MENRFNQRFEGLPAEIWQTVSQIDEYKGRWIAGAQLNPQALGRLKRSVLVTSTGASTRIEGAKLSDEDIEKMMRGIDIQKFADRDKQEARGYYELLENIFNSWKSLQVSENSIKHFHKELLKYVVKDETHRGEYKKQENKVIMVNQTGESVGVLFDTAPAYLVPKEMQELVEWAQEAFKEKKYHPLLIIANFTVEFLAIHPFQDGNGRLSRILTNLLLLKHGYQYTPYISHEKLVEDNKPEYYLALRKSQKTFNSDREDIIPWLAFFFKILLKQSQIAIDLLSKENIEKLFSPKQLQIWEYFQQVSEAAPAQIAKATNIARPTINQALDKLLRLKKIERFGQGRATRYRKV